LFFYTLRLPCRVFLGNQASSFYCIIAVFSEGDDGQDVECSG